jgi:hypothetical protein
MGMPINVAASLQNILDDMRRIERVLNALVDRVYKSIKEAEDLKRYLEAQGHVFTTEVGPLVYNLRITTNPDESAEVALNFGPSFHLGRRLTGLLSLLVSAIPEDPQDELGGWISKEQIINHLKVSTGKPFTRKYVNGMIWLLQKALDDAHYPRKLIQTHPDKGVRLAFKRGAKGGPPDTSPLGTPTNRKPEIPWQS